MDREKFIYLIYEFLSEQGGLEREMINHARFLMGEGYRVKILTCYFDRAILKQLPFEGIEIESIAKVETGIEWADMALCFLGFNKLREYSPDAFLSYSAPSNFLIRGKRGKKIGYVNHFPHYLYLKGRERVEWAASTQGIKRWVVVLMSMLLGGWLRRVDRRLIRANDLNFMNSSYTKRKLDELYGFSAEETIVSYPPLDRSFDIGGGIGNRKDKIDWGGATGQVKGKVDEAGVSITDNNMGGGEGKYIFSSSRIIPDKKYELLVSAMSRMKHKLPLFLAGGVEERYRRSLEKMGRKKRVDIRFLGRLGTEEIIEYYGNAEVFAFPTPKEDFGLVPAESLACGTPVVVWGDGAGPTEQVIDGVNGFLAKPYDIGDFAAKIDKAIDSGLKKKGKREIVGSAKKFSYDSVKKGFLGAVKRIV